MSGTISFQCWISWNSRCFPAAFLVSQTGSRMLCQRELRKVLPKKVPQWRNQDQWIFVVKEPILRKIRAILIAPGIRNCIRVLFHPAAGNWRETSTKTQQCILKRGTGMILNLPAPGNWGGEMNLRAQPAPGNCSEVKTSKSEGQKDGVPQHANLWSSIPRESLQNPSEKVESRRKCTIDGYWSIEDQGVDMVIVYVDNDESRHSSWTKLHWNFGSFQEHKLRGSSKFIRYHAEIDIGPSRWHSECDNDYWTAPSWTRSTLTHDQVVRWTKAKVRVYSGSVLCLVKLSENSEAKAKKGKSSWRIATIQFHRELFGVDGAPIENRLSSSGIFSQDWRHSRSSRRSRETSKIETLNLKILKIESSSCQCSVTSIGRREAIQNVLQIPKKSRSMRWDSREHTGHSSALKTTNSVTELSVTHRKMGFTATQMVERFKETGHPVFKSTRALSLRNSEKKE